MQQPGTGFLEIGFVKLLHDFVRVTRDGEEVASSLDVVNVLFHVGAFWGQL